MTYQRFVALGDSCTEGLDDPYPGGAVYRGWADLVADRLARENAGFRYANLGVRGRRLDQIIVEQIPAATSLRPDLIALFGGGNDIMSHGYDERTVARRVDHAVQALTELSPHVVVFTLSDISRRMPFGWRMGPRIEALNAAIREAAVSYGAILVDLWGDHAANDSRYFGPDRLHLAEAGHRRLAAHMLASLKIPHEESWLAPLLGTPARPSALANARWLCNQVWPLVRGRIRNRLIGRQPGDGIQPKRPDLLPVTEWRPVRESA
ncbi:lysophospholipase L1-like esterase [Kibdelosporangium banguiense]|uniref:Lysophospholipase L1-like esterase n=1 Tax=Kibdelosporangium banguiense TaxID=1365924 RepID=A0ABS4T6I7_9PSEU|nr:SGNH/GDSL hydrolase family protein [Kibdelosporangium banguiense]MBP2319866.1 lysophospholipase L1-like esterase [Kibdelosporangium banguiense]